MPSAAIDKSLAEFQIQLMGSTWANQALPGAPNDEGSESNPLSYNVMPLPQSSAENGLILKNCTIFETLQFNGVDSIATLTTAANRSPDHLQLPTALYYQQQVHFGDGPNCGDVVHTENGSWLHMTTGVALQGPYDSPVVGGNAAPQPADRTIAKQMSVPHGNSVLALGKFDPATTQMLQIPDTPVTTPLPIGPFEQLYKTKLDGMKDYQNPLPALTANPNLPLQQAVEILQPNSTLHWHVTTNRLPDGMQGQVANIPFERAAARVSAYSADYWLMSNDGGNNYDYLAYSQIITLDAFAPGLTHFPHVTTNVLTRQC